jgi:hypothetical protein
MSPHRGAPVARFHRVGNVVGEALAALAISVALTGCAAHQAEKVGPAIAMTTSEASQSTTTSAAPTAPTTTVSPATEDTSPQNQATSADEAALTAAYIAFTHFPPGDIAGIQAGSLHYAYLPSTETYWAIARFEPTPKASQQTLVNLQDNASIGIFSHGSGAPWTLVRTGSAPFCPSQWGIPSAVLSQWGLSDASVCTPSTTIAAA